MCLERNHPGINVFAMCANDDKSVWKEPHPTPSPPREHKEEKQAAEGLWACKKNKTPGVRSNKRRREKREKEKKRRKRRKRRKNIKDHHGIEN